MALLLLGSGVTVRIRCCFLNGCVQFTFYFASSSHDDCRLLECVQGVVLNCVDLDLEDNVLCY